MIKTKLFPINLQEGFIVAEEGNTIYAAYNHYHKCVIATNGMIGVTIPKSISHYEIHRKACNGLSIHGFTDNGDASLGDIHRILTK